MKIRTDIVQNSVDWQIARAGVVTASEVDALVSPLGKVRTGQGPHTYLVRKLVERWTGGPLISIQGVFDMDQGKILEDEAKPFFTLHTGLDIRDVAFITSDDGRIGCSPDAMIDDKCGLELKCPKLETHVGYLLGGELPLDYVTQVQFSMYVTGFEQWHFMSYRRRLPPLYLVIDRDKKMHEAFDEALKVFFGDMDDAMEQLTKLNGGLPQQRFTKPLPQPEPETESADVIP